MKNYIVKNCENLQFGKYCPFSNITEYCKDCTDCLIKQIVELCNNACIDCKEIKRVTYTQCKDLNRCTIAKILTNLDIEEVE